MVQIRARAGVALALAAAVAAAAWIGWTGARQEQPAERARLGLMTSLPIYWADGADITTILAEGASAPWTRTTLEQRYELVPLDTLAAVEEGGPDAAQVDPLRGIDRLLVVQPRGLSPQDNVALDKWVQAGGQLFYVLDPMLTGMYAVPLGDPRHPSAAGLIPPVLTRWGLGVRFDDRQALELHTVETGAGRVPVMLAGTVQLDPHIAPRCTVEGEALLAQCRVGKGRVTLLADAALFELPQGDGGSRETLLALATKAFE